MIEPFKSHITEQEQLDEKLIRTLVRTGAVIASANTSKRYGDTAVKHLKSVSTIIKKPTSSDSRVQTDERLDKLEQSLLAMSEALIAMRFQIGSLTSVATSAALLADTAAKETNIKPRRGRR